ncbi:MAG: helix-turn-helix domain-containing protein [Phycisphaerae bacterium]|nr:helix-turn-helix domain-containing protein [Phycisphaerae bacterium]
MIKPDDKLSYTWPLEQRAVSCRMIALLVTRRTVQKNTPWHSHTHWQLEITTSGKIQFETPRQEGRPQNGEFILLPPNCQHRFVYPHKQAGWVSICFQAEGFTGVPSEMFSPCRFSRLLVSTATRKTFAPHHKAEMEGLLCSLLAHCYPDRFAADKSALLRRIDEFLLTQPGRFATVEDVAAAVGYSANHLSTLLRRQTGEGLKRYIDLARNRHARDLLRCTTLPISQIARQVGCENIHAFSRFFLRMNRQRPRQFRNAQ